MPHGIKKPSCPIITETVSFSFSSPLSHSKLFNNTTNYNKPTASQPWPKKFTNKLKCLTELVNISHPQYPFLSKDARSILTPLEKCLLLNWKMVVWYVYLGILK